MSDRLDGRRTEALQLSEILHEKLNELKGALSNVTPSGRSPSSSMYPGGAFMISTRCPGCIRSFLTSGLLAMVSPFKDVACDGAV